jgi:hypothetical protein
MSLRRKATEFNDEELRRHLKLGGGMYLDDPDETAIKKVQAKFQPQIDQILDICVSMNERLQTLIDNQMQARQSLLLGKSLSKFRGVDLAST